MARENGDFSRCADPVPLRFHAKVKEGRILFPPKASNCLLLRRHGLDNFDLTAIVAAALLAHSVRQVQSTALGACNETGDSQLPGGAASLIASCFGYFSLRYCHCDTSLIYKGQAALFILYLFSKSFARTVSFNVLVSALYFSGMCISFRNDSVSRAEACLRKDIHILKELTVHCIVFIIRHFFGIFNTYGTGSFPPGFQGWHRQILFIPSQPPFKSPYLTIACLVYSEQVG